MTCWRLRWWWSFFYEHSIFKSRYVLFFGSNAVAHLKGYKYSVNTTFICTGKPKICNWLSCSICFIVVVQTGHGLFGMYLRYAFGAAQILHLSLKKCSYSLSCFWLFTIPMDCSPPGPSAHGIFQARILEWVAIAFSRESSRPRDQTCFSGRPLTVWATRGGSSLLWPNFHLFLTQHTRSIGLGTSQEASPFRVQSSWISNKNKRVGFLANMY